MASNSSNSSNSNASMSESGIPDTPIVGPGGGGSNDTRVPGERYQGQLELEAVVAAHQESFRDRERRIQFTCTRGCILGTKPSEYYREEDSSKYAALC
jgi:hypothetical protein